MRQKCVKIIAQHFHLHHLHLLIIIKQGRCSDMSDENIQTVIGCLNSVCYKKAWEIGLHFLVYLEPVKHLLRNTPMLIYEVFGLINVLMRARLILYYLFAEQIASICVSTFYYIVCNRKYGTIPVFSKFIIAILPFLEVINVKNALDIFITGKYGQVKFHGKKCSVTTFDFIHSQTN